MENNEGNKQEKERMKRGTRRQFMIIHTKDQTEMRFLWLFQFFTKYEFFFKKDFYLRFSYHSCLFSSIIPLFNWSDKKNSFETSQRGRFEDELRAMQSRQEAISSYQREDVYRLNIIGNIANSIAMKEMWSIRDIAVLVRTFGCCRMTILFEKHTWAYARLCLQSILIDLI